MNNLYLHDKFSSAVHSMATSPKSIQERIAEAYIFHLIHVKIEDVPEDIKCKYQNLKERLTSVNAIANEGTVMASIKDMPTEEAISIANDILCIASVIASLYNA